jgi:hypothetical protein
MIADMIADMMAATTAAITAMIAGSPSARRTADQPAPDESYLVTWMWSRLGLAAFAD